MRNELVIPGPEAVLWWGVHVPVLAMVFGVVGVLLGHLIAPVAVPPMPLQRQVAVVLAGVLLSVGITITTGQKPLIVLGWSLGIGFAGITIFQTLGSQAARASRELTDIVIDRLAGRAGEQGDRGQ